MQYTDDTLIIFMQGDVDQLRCLKDMLISFAESKCLKVNFVLELFQIHFSILARLLTKRSGGPSPEAWAGA
jgi:hypothetical protein